MFYSGISDEAGQSIDTQILAHKDLGWNHIELRNVDGENITQLHEDKFFQIEEKLKSMDMQVSCFGSAIANWARPITNDPQADIDDLMRSIPRMHSLGTPFIRIMSYPNDQDNPLPEAEWRNEAIKRVKEFARIAEGEGIILAHENCSGWGGLSPENNLILLEEVNSPALKVVYDTGNPVTYGQNAWDYYKKVSHAVCYVHIKDARHTNGQNVYCYCGDGEGYVKETITDLLANGYDGGFSIEPHLAAVIHTGEQTKSEDALFQSYTEYGRRLMKIVEEAKASG